MGRKKKVVEPKAPEPKVFEYGDLVVVCKCGRTQTVRKGMKEGINIVLAPREDSYVQLVCNECGADLRLCFVEGVAPVEVEPMAVEVIENGNETIIKPKTVDESVQKEDKQEQSL
jgi:transcription elongation factor Elf1